VGVVEDEQFWRLIGVVGPRGGTGRLVAALARLSGEEIIGFHERLRAVVAMLDSPAHRAQPVADVSGGVPAPLSEDGFEDARLAVVAAGHRRWSAAVADPMTLGGTWPLAAGEGLGEAAAEAYERATGDPWPDLDLVAVASAGLPPAARPAWLMLLPADGMPPAYEDQLGWLERTLAAPAWERWWDAGRGDGSVVTCRYETDEAGRRRSGLRIGRDASGRVEVRVTIRVPPLPHAGRDWADPARAHVRMLFGVLASKLGMSAPPDLPPPAELERQRRAAALRDAVEAEAFAAWNARRTMVVPSLWSGRAPAEAIDELITTLENGGRIRIPVTIARMRARYAIPATTEDARHLAENGYTTEEIATALT
jgi:hypothetical protein